MGKPLAIDLFTGLHGWAEGLVAEGYDVVGFDLEDGCAKFGFPRPEHVSLVVQDVLTLYGSQFRHAALIVASPPCQFFSYTAMPWTRAKQLADEVRADPARLETELALFKACFRIQREACEASGRHVPLVVENVCGAQPWIGRAKRHFGSYYLWGDVPERLPLVNRAARKSHGLNWSTQRGVDFTRLAGDRRVDGRKVSERIVHVRDGVPHTAHLTNEAEHIKCGGDWFSGSDPSAMCHFSSKSSSRRRLASAMIAKIPLSLSRCIARSFHSDRRSDTRLTPRMLFEMNRSSDVIDWRD